MEEYKSESASNEPAEETKEESVSDHQEYRTLRRSSKNKIIAGVCGGIGECFQIDPVFIRLFFVLSIILGGWGLVAYLLAALLIQKEDMQNIGLTDDHKQTIQIEIQTLMGSSILFLGIYLFLESFGFLSYINVLGLNNQFLLPIILIAAGIFVFVKRESFVEKNNTPLPENLSRNSEDKLIAGVCGGFAVYLGMNSTLVRIIWFIAAFITLGLAFLIYLFFIPLTPKNVSNLE